MSQSLKSRFKKLKHDGKITEAELEELMKKLDGHDVVIYNKALDDLVNVCKRIDSFEYAMFSLGVIREVAEKLKGEIKNEID